MVSSGRHQTDFILGLESAVEHPHQHDDADIVIKPGIDDERLERCVRIALGWRDTRHYGFQHILHALAGFGRATHRIGRLDTDDVLDFLDHPLRIGGWEIDFVQHRHYLYALLDGGIAVCDALCLHALRSEEHTSELQSQ